MKTLTIERPKKGDTGIINIELLDINGKKDLENLYDFIHENRPTVVKFSIQKKFSNFNDYSSAANIWRGIINYFSFPIDFNRPNYRAKLSFIVAALIETDLLVQLKNWYDWNSKYIPIYSKRKIDDSPEKTKIVDQILGWCPACYLNDPERKINLIAIYLDEKFFTGMLSGRQSIKDEIANYFGCKFNPIDDKPAYSVFIPLGHILQLNFLFEKDIHFPQSQLSSWSRNQNKK